MTKTQWPKKPATLTSQQVAAREEFGRWWFDELPSRYAAFERFNNTAFPPLPNDRPTWRTLEVGAGIGGHLAFEDLGRQEYYCADIRSEFCDRLRQNGALAGVVNADIEKGTPFAAGFFDRVIAIHTLEHLRNLPLAVREFSRLLKPDGILDVVLPCEGGFAYNVARRISTKRMFEKRFAISYDPIIASEHVNTFGEAMHELTVQFVSVFTAYFPFKLAVPNINLCVATRMEKRQR